MECITPVRTAWPGAGVMMRFKAVTPAQQAGGQAVTALQKRRFVFVSEN